MLTRFKRILAGLKYVLTGELPQLDELGSSTSYGMTTAAEQRLFTRAVADIGTISGEIVDLGCWLGSTTIALARGLEETGQAGKIYAFDLFKWDTWMDDYSKDHWGDYRPGESFLPEARKRMGKWLSKVELIEADLTQFHWNGGFIRLLLVDAMKSWELATVIVREFFPKMVVGALVIQQDYLAFSIPWIPILHFRLREFMEHAETVERGDTVSFRVIKPISLAAAIKAGDFSTLTDEEAESAFTWSLEQCGPKAKAGTESVRVMYYFERGDFVCANALYLKCQSNDLNDQRYLAPIRKAMNLTNR